MLSKGLTIVSIEKISHEEARNWSFKIGVGYEDRELALSGEIWPFGVRVRQFRNYRTRDENQDRRNGNTRNG